MEFMKKISTLFFCALFLMQCMIHADEQARQLINTYPLIIEKLIYYKSNAFEVFYGGPIDKKDQGVRWMMPVVFQDENNKTRAVYEVSFVNCTPDSAQDAEILCIDISEIDIKFKNNITPDYMIASSLFKGDYKNGKYIVIRFADIANVYYPDIFVHALYGKSYDSDKADIATYLHEHYHAQKGYRDYYKYEIPEEIDLCLEDRVIYKPILIQTTCGQELFSFSVVKVIQKKDAWKVYYLIYKSDTTLKSLASSEAGVLVRLDSGCVSGQIYDDESCDCLDQLHAGLHEIAQDQERPGIIIHIPTHDGRGFGTAPKAETEIYKRGGKGRVHTTPALDTVAAAKLLYGVDKYDFRSFDGAAELLTFFGIKKVILLTDNIEKVELLQRYGIDVIRKKTETNKISCITHIEAKRNSSQYFTE